MGYVPDLPGCISSGPTLKEMQKGIRCAVDAFISERREEAFPLPATHVVHFPHPSEGHEIDYWVIENVEITFSDSGRPIKALKGRAITGIDKTTAYPSTRRRGDSLRMTARSAQGTSYSSRSRRRRKVS